jgi:hypothetical protein
MSFYLFVFSQTFKFDRVYGDRLTNYGNNLVSQDPSLNVVLYYTPTDLKSYMVLVFLIKLVKI